jgi:hypothetical protein
MGGLHIISLELRRHDGAVKPLILKPGAQGRF